MICEQKRELKLIIKTIAIPSEEKLPMKKDEEKSCRLLIAFENIFGVL